MTCWGSAWRPVSSKPCAPSCAPLEHGSTTCVLRIPVCSPTFPSARYTSARCARCSSGTSARRAQHLTCASRAGTATRPARARYTSAATPFVPCTRTSRSTGCTPRLRAPAAQTTATHGAPSAQHPPGGRSSGLESGMGSGNGCSSGPVPAGLYPAWNVWFQTPGL
eukprot:365331-Chlamydomonas_euryale.AAC.6